MQDQNRFEFHYTPILALFFNISGSVKDDAHDAPVNTSMAKLFSTWKKQIYVGLGGFFFNLVFVVVLFSCLNEAN